MKVKNQETVKKMKARIDRVAFVGWRGIAGCEVLDLHESLTGLIGAGGAGKSTLIMAIDYAILPDRRALNIRPISDLHDAQNSGVDSVMGRLNPDYGYAYVALDITTRHGDRLIAGIHVEPLDGRAKFNYWTMRNVPAGAKLESLLAVVEDETVQYPDFPLLRRHLATQGIDMLACRSIGEYGQNLYDAGIIPSSMGQQADRTLYANLIETTFRGGISQEVATKLKEYLLPEQTQVQDIVRGLQECTNEVLKTRNAVADANRELQLLQSTYGVGKEAVLTALYGICEDRAAASLRINELTVSLDRKTQSKLDLEKSIPSIENQVAEVRKTSETILHVKMGELKDLDTQKSELNAKVIETRTAATDATGRLSRFNKGKQLWKSLAGEHTDRDFAWLLEWFKRNLQTINEKQFLIKQDMQRLQEEDAKLSSNRSSPAAEALADTLGVDSLEVALKDIDQADSPAYELALGGLVDGVVGADIDVLASLAPSNDLPSLFWLGLKPPALKDVHEIKDWLLMPHAGGYMVSRKDRPTVFGSDARARRREAIEVEIKELSVELTALGVKASAIDKKRETLLKSNDLLEFYFEHRGAPDVLDVDVQATDKAYSAAAQEFNKVKAKHDALAEEIEKIQQPYQNQIIELSQQLADKRSSHDKLEREIAAATSTLNTDRTLLSEFEAEISKTREILGHSFDRFLKEAVSKELPTRNVLGLQAQRIVELQKTLGDEVVTRTPTLRDVNPEDRVSVIAIWPHLLSIVREMTSVDAADADGDDLIQEMQERRAKLDSDLVRQEGEVRINASNITMHINGSVRTQKGKVDKLSRLGQTIEFGNVTGIQIKLVPRDKMLEILGNFADQISLFGNDKPVDQVLRDFFEAASAGGVKMEGKHLLDYRNYVDLVIEARRRDGAWNAAVSLSGTESIGSGLAIALMLARSIASRGEASGEGVKVDQIRPLFAVDEVSRVDPEGQKMLADFARRENFQLLVTAPTLRPDYNCYLYALSRHYSPKERLIIRGVRVKAQGEKAAA